MEGTTPEETPESEHPPDSPPDTPPDTPDPQPNGNSGRKFSSDSPSIEEIMRLKKPHTVSVEISLDPEIAQAMWEAEQEIEDLEKRLNRERARARSQTGKSLADGSELQEIQKQIEAAEGRLEALWDDAEGSIAEFVFQDIGRKRYDDLVSEHPPTAEEKRQWEAEGGEGKLAYSTESFPPALISATAIKPEIDLATATKICDEWGNGEVYKLMNAAQASCVGISSVPKSRRSLTDTVETPTSG